jgi:hypothetical protein
VPPTATLPPTSTPAVTNTPLATTSSGGATGCDSATFVSDVTIPDGEEIAPDAEFVKTWRLKNSGTCTWSTSYSLVFASGNAMDGTASQALSGSIAPGSNVDVSVTLTAPPADGEYTGYWALRNASGQNFASFYVQISVGEGGASGDAKTISGSPVGQVNTTGTIGAAAHAGSSSGVDVRAFVSFNISSIPTDATIEEVKVDFSGYDTVGNPFASLGCLQGFAGSYFPLDAADYLTSGSGPDMAWCSTGELSTVFINEAVKDRLQDAVDASSGTLQYQLRFTGSPSGDLLVRFLNGGVKLIITYSEP